MALEGKNLSLRYGNKGPWIVENLSLSLERGERVGLVAPSGFGKTTLLRMLSGYLTPCAGEVLVEGKPLPQKGICPVQLIYQHPEKAINPRWKMGQVLAEAGVPQKGEALAQRCRALGIQEDWLNRYPRELSGGELQRFCIARSLFPGVEYLLADEMSTMLDVITQAQLWQVVLEEVKQSQIGLLVVTHTPALAEKVCQRVIRWES